MSQLKWRIAEGQGEAIYELGVADNGDLHGLAADDLQQSYETLQRMAAELQAETTRIATRVGQHGDVSRVQCDALLLMRDCAVLESVGSRVARRQLH